jgi:hypothetical protein
MKSGVVPRNDGEPSLAGQVKNELRFELSGIGRRPAAKEMGVLRRELSGIA